MHILDSDEDPEVARYRFVAVDEGGDRGLCIESCGD
jgi:hypothetical protein